MALDRLQKLQPVFKGGLFVQEGKYITAGNASQLSDGSAAVLMMERKEAETRGLEALGVYRGMAVAGCGPEEMGIGPVFAIPKLLERFKLKMDDIGLWELNEAFAVQVLYCQDVLGIPVRKVIIQVVAGRNIAVLVEAAVRNSILQLRGIDTYADFVARHHKAMEAARDDD